MMRDATTSLAHLPEGCITDALSFTSPRDACRLSLVSRTFLSAAESDALWDSFLSRDYPSIISRSCTAPSSSSKKHLYLCLSLCDKPLLIDDGLKSILLDKLSGKKCYMLSARSLSIVCPLGHSRWTSVPEARFKEVAKLLSVCWLEIRGWINTRMLSPSTLYATYLVFNLTAGANGFEDQPVEVSIRIPGRGTHKRTVYLDAERGRRLQYQIVPRRAGIFNRTRIMGVEARTPIPAENLDLQYPKQRADGWLEIELGNFFNEGGDDQELEMAVREIKGGHWKSGLVIQGFDIRPKLNQ